MSKRLKEIPQLVEEIKKLMPEWSGLREIDIIEITLREKLKHLQGGSAYNSSNKGTWTSIISS